MMWKRKPIKESDLTSNRLQYALLGDPAMPLNVPTLKVVVDSVNGISTSDASAKAMLKAGMVARIDGHIEGNEAFNGVVTATVRDSKELITCRQNDGTSDAFTFYDRTKTLYNGSDSVVGGKFSFQFAVPKDINYTDESDWSISMPSTMTGPSVLMVRAMHSMWVEVRWQRMILSVRLSTVISIRASLRGWWKREPYAFLCG